VLIFKKVKKLLNFKSQSIQHHTCIVPIQSSRPAAQRAHRWQPGTSSPHGTLQQPICTLRARTGAGSPVSQKPGRFNRFYRFDCTDGLFSEPNRCVSGSRFFRSNRQSDPILITRFKWTLVLFHHQ